MALDELNELIKKETKIQEEIIVKGKEINPGQNQIVPDGIVSPKLYLDSRYKKIMWMLKEPYGVGGIGKLGEDFLDNPKRRQEIIKNNPAIGVMAYVTYSLLNNKLYDEINGLENDTNMNEVITRIAWVNISKISDTSKSEKEKLEMAYKFWRDILFKQIKTYSPQVLIFGGTFSHFNKDWKKYFGYLPKRNMETFNKYFFHYFVQNNMLIISACHPTEPSINKQIGEYVNAILDIVNNKSQK